MQHQEGNSVRAKERGKAAEFYRRAIQEYAALLRARPSHFWAYYDGASCHFELGNLDEAAIGYTMCIQIRPEVPWPYNNRGAILRQQKQYAAAVEDLNVASKLNPRYTQALLNRALAHADLAYAGEMDFSSACQDAARLIELEPTNAQHYRMHGAMSLRQREFEAALRDWDAMGKLLPKSSEPHLHRARTLRAAGRYEEALTAAAAAVDRAPEDSKPRLLRVQILHQQGRLADALQELESVARQNPADDGEMLNDRGDLLRSLRRDQEALACYERSIDLVPKQINAYVAAALIHLDQQRLDQADQLLERLVSANSDSSAAYLRLADLRRAQGRWEDALRAGAQAARLDPKSRLPALSQASVLAARGDYEAAVAAAEPVLRAAPRRDGELLYAAACVYGLASTAARMRGNEALAAQYRERGAALLVEAIQSVLDLDYQAVNRIAWDPALAALRSDPRVQERLPILATLGRES